MNHNDSDRRIAHWRFVVWLAPVLFFGLAACSLSSRLEVASEQPVDLNGRWLLDRQASDDVRARLLPLFERKEKRWRREEREYDVAPPANAPAEAPRGELSTIGWMQQRRQREAQAIISMLSPGSVLEIAQSPRDIRISSDKGEGSRTLTPGRSSALFTSMGGFDVSSGWDGIAFVVDSSGSGETELRTVERYTLIENGATLEARLDVKVPDIGKQSFRFVYRRG